MLVQAFKASTIEDLQTAINTYIAGGLYTLPYLEDVSTQITSLNKTTIQVTNYPIISPSSPGTTTTIPTDVQVYDNGVLVPILSVDGTNGIVVTAKNLTPTDTITIFYSYQSGTEIVLTASVSWNFSPDGTFAPDYFSALLSYTIS